MLTVGSPALKIYTGVHFPSVDSRVSQSNVLAPFWNDYDTRGGSNVYYKQFNPDISKSELDYVNRFISAQRNVKFEGNWMVVAHWVEVPRFPHSTQSTTVSQYKTDVSHSWRMHCMFVSLTQTSITLL